MDTDDLEPLPKKVTPAKALDALSVTALEAYILELEQEINRVRLEIGKRGQAKQAAETFFKPKS